MTYSNIFKVILRWFFRYFVCGFEEVYRSVFLRGQGHFFFIQKEADFFLVMASHGQSIHNSN